jgi:hypothetical protein
MAGRRNLIEGLRGAAKAQKAKEEAFVFGADDRPATRKPKAKANEPSKTPLPAMTVPAPTAGRSPLTTRLRADLAGALKRASLERQLAGQEPHTVQEILEEALEPWLRHHGYLK